jgi:hypothetical protein
VFPVNVLEGTVLPNFGLDQQIQRDYYHTVYRINGQPGFHRINDQTGFSSNKRTDGITYSQEDIWDFTDQEDGRD